MRLKGCSASQIIEWLKQGSDGTIDSLRNIKN